ncbi:hypothetical protein [Bacterioplanes sanyensis]|uniref:hypothetical protein n=1 Tax=Bacterioplanes sanyensis TaxID=1249553 RepID=UPI0012FE5AB7|nr:hypothetical protein [Bacterioplanes sanyensis]
MLCSIGVVARPIKRLKLALLSAIQPSLAYTSASARATAKSASDQPLQQQHRWVLLQQTSHDNLIRLRQHGHMIDIRPSSYYRCNFH